MSDTNHRPDAAPSGQTVHHARATAAEVNEFLQRLKGKNPQEVLGIAAESGLVRAVIQATVGTLVLLVVFTVVPYTLSKQAPAKKAAAPAKVEPAEQAAKPANAAPTPAPASPAAPVAAVPGAEPQQPPVSEKALEKLGTTETKQSSPKVNPLEKSADDLLKDLDKK